MFEKFNDYVTAKGSKFNGTETLMDNKIRLHKSGATQLGFQQKGVEIEKGATICDASIPYRKMVGSLRWLSNGSGHQVLL